MTVTAVSGVTELFLDPATVSAKFEIVEMGAGDTTLTTSDKQIVICNNTAAGVVTLNLLPADGERVHIKRRAAAITIAGTIDGMTDLVLIGSTDAAHLLFSTINNEWEIL